MNKVDDLPEEFKYFIIFPNKHEIGNLFWRNIYHIIMKIQKYYWVFSILKENI